MVIVFLEEFEIERHSTCNKDFIEIRNGTTSTSTLIAKICGTTKPRTRTTQGNTVWIRFKSDAQSNKKGFALQAIELNLGEGSYQQYYLRSNQLFSIILN